MKILTVVVNLEKGGTQRAAQNFAVAYRGLGHDSRVLAVRGGGSRENELRNRDVGYWLTPESFPLVMDWKPDLVHFHSYGIEHSQLRSLVAQHRGARLIETNVFAEPSIIEPDLDISLQLSDWCAYLYKSRRGDLKKIRIVPNPIEVESFFRADQQAIQDFRREHGIPSGVRLVGRLGQAGTHNWSYYILGAFREMQSRVGERWHLLLCNPPAALEQAIQKDEFIRQNSTIIPFLIGDEKLRAFYSALDIFAHIADNGESFGMAVAEAMLCETPVVSLNTPWFHNTQGSVIGRGVGGYCANTLDEFADRLTALAGDEALRHKLGKAGRARIIERYASVTVAEQLLRTMSEPEPYRVRTDELLKFTKGDLHSRLLLWIQGALKSVRVSNLVSRCFKRKAAYKVTLVELSQAGRRG